MLFPPVVKVIFAADSSGNIKARLSPGKAARDVKRNKAGKISDNLIQYAFPWNDKEPIELQDDEIVLIGTISNYTKKRGWLKTDDPQIIENIFLHNERVVRLKMPGLETLPLGDPNPVNDILLIYNSQLV